MLCANEEVLMTPYSKPYLSYTQQIELLKSRGLIIQDEAYAMLRLKHISYYRLSAYFIPFCREVDIFKEGVTFDQVIDVYHFDRELRLLTFGAIEKIEVFLRASIAHNFSKKCGAFCHLDKGNLCIKNDRDYTWLMEDIQKETKRSKESFVKHFKERYSDKDLPVWMSVEIISFGTLSKLYSLLCKDVEKEILDGIQLPSFVFKNWLHLFSYVRNTAAHHSRLWNRRFVIKAKIPKHHKHFKGIANDNYFTFAVMAYYVLTSIDDAFDLKKELIMLFERYPDVDKKQMGFDDGWEKMDIWKR